MSHFINMYVQIQLFSSVVLKSYVPQPKVKGDILVSVRIPLESASVSASA